MTSFMSSHVSRLRSGLRSRNAGWNVGTSRRSRHGQARPRRREIGSLRVQQRLRREGPERDHHLRLHHVDLPEQERLAGGHFVGLGVAVAGRPALEDVGDVDVLARVAHRLDDLGEQLAGAADERLALDVFVGARRLAHEHQIRARVADAVDDLLPPLRVQLAADAVAEVFADRGQGRGGCRIGRPRVRRIVAQRGGQIVRRPPARHWRHGGPARRVHAGSRLTPSMPSSP